MSHKRSNEDLRAARLLGELDTARDSAAWQAEESRQQAWVKANDDRREPPEEGVSVKDFTS
jgi:hypothetical protein